MKLAVPWPEALGSSLVAEVDRDSTQDEYEDSGDHDVACSDQPDKDERFGKQIDAENNQDGASEVFDALAHVFADPDAEGQP